MKATFHKNVDLIHIAHITSTFMYKKILIKMIKNGKTKFLSELLSTNLN